jgi:hypothetical protein
MAVFIAGHGDERLTLDEAKALANGHGTGHYFFDCTPDEYHAQSLAKNLDTGEWV